MDYHLASRMDRLDVATQRSHLRSCMSVEANDLVDQYLRVRADAPVDTVVDCLTAHYQRTTPLIQ